MDRQATYWLRYSAALLGCLLVLSTSALLGIALRRHPPRPPDVHVHFGDIQLIGFVAHPASFFAPATLAPGTNCQSAAARCPSRRGPVYAVWLVDDKRIAQHSKSAFHRLFAVPLSLAQLFESLST